MSKAGQRSDAILRRAIAAAKAGQRVQARYLLCQLVEMEPQHEMAWLWLSDLLPTLSQQIEALDKALNLNPQNLPAQRRYQQLKRKLADIQTEQALLREQRLQEVQRFLMTRQISQAQTLLLQLVEDDESDEAAWWLLSQVTEDVVDQVVALENVLTLNPGHELAQTHLVEKQRLLADDLALGLYYEQCLNWQKAARVYLHAAACHPDVRTRREAILRHRAAELEILYPGVLSSRSTFTWLRLSVGPPLFFVLLLFVHAGLRPLNIPLPGCLGALLVLGGSLLLVGLYNTPLHPFWNYCLGPLGLSRRYARFTISLSGLTCLSTPFIILIIVSVTRALRP